MSSNVLWNMACNNGSVTIDKCDEIRYDLTVHRR